MNKRTEKILKKDSIAETEKILDNKHWSEFNYDENLFMLGKSIVDNENKNKYLASMGDTYFEMSWEKFKQLIVKKGFLVAMEYDFQHKDNVDEFIIYYHPQKGLIICATSYWNKKSINDGTLYGEIQANSKDDIQTIYRWLSTGGCIDEDKMIFSTSRDIREGLFSVLDELETAGKFLSKWIEKNRFLWFVDYVEKNAKGFDYKKISKEKLAKCPREMQEIIGSK
jgi:hypothetical protein